MINPTTNTPDWSTAPTWAKYTAQEPNGEWDWYRFKPTPIRNPDKTWYQQHNLCAGEGWMPNPKDQYRIVRTPKAWHEPAGITEPNDAGWHKTLQKRPTREKLPTGELIPTKNNHAPTNSKKNVNTRERLTK